MMPLNFILRKYSGNYRFTYTDDPKLLAKNEKEMAILIQKIRIFSKDLGMEFAVEKCALFILKRGKRQITEE